MVKFSNFREISLPSDSACPSVDKNYGKKIFTGLPVFYGEYDAIFSFEKTSILKEFLQLQVCRDR